MPSSPSLLLVFTAPILLTELAIYLVFFFFFLPLALFCACPTDAPTPWPGCLPRPAALPAHRFFGPRRLSPFLPPLSGRADDGHLNRFRLFENKLKCKYRHYIHSWVQPNSRGFWSFVHTREMMTLDLISLSPESQLTVFTVFNSIRN